ncbi:MAG: hypothetical protein WBY44_27070 [Bryobacteraceae bacterium]
MAARITSPDSTGSHPSIAIPFDRALIAQAIADDLVLLTADGEIPKYASGNFQPLH